MDVSKNKGTPKSSILIGFSFINHPFWGTPILGKPPYPLIFCFKTSIACEGGGRTQFSFQQGAFFFSAGGRRNGMLAEVVSFLHNRCESARCPPLYSFNWIHPRGWNGFFVSKKLLSEPQQLFDLGICNWESRSVFEYPKKVLKREEVERLSPSEFQTSC